MLVRQALWTKGIFALLVETPYVCLCQQNGWCLEYKASEVTVYSGEERNSREFLDYITLKVSFDDGECRHLQDLEGFRVEAETNG